MLTNYAGARLQGKVVKLRANLVRLLWVLQPLRVIEYKKADRFANRGTTDIRTTLFSVGLPKCYLEELLRKCLEQMAPT